MYYTADMELWQETPIWQSIFQDNLYKLVPQRQNVLDIMSQEITEFWDDSGNGWTVCKQSAPCSKQQTAYKASNTLDNKTYHANTSSLNYYRLDALLDA